jgi:hypothetical protein
VVGTSADLTQLRTNIVSVAISDDGYWLAVSDLYETKLFRLSVSVSGLFPLNLSDLLPPVTIPLTPAVA